MMNIKFNGFGMPNTYMSICDYDLHGYKASDIVIEEETKNNVCLVDNMESFMLDVFKYKDDLRNSIVSDHHLERFKQKREQYKKQILELENSKKKYEKHPNILKQIDTSIKHLKTVAKQNSTRDQIARYEFNTSKVMRSYRIAVNHIELDSLHKPTDTPEQRRQNIINFYKDCLVKIERILKENNQLKIAPKIVKADIHFDQTSPHLHVHISNLYEREIKRLNRTDVMTCNINLSDPIRSLKQISEIEESKLKPNEQFTKILQADQPEKYKLLNTVDLVKLMPMIYDVNSFKREMAMKQTGKRFDMNGSNNWRANKEIAFKMHERALEKFGLKKDETNKIKNARKLNEATTWLFKQNCYYGIATKISDPKKVEGFFERSLQSKEFFLSQNIKGNLNLNLNNIKQNFDKVCLNLPKFEPSLEEIHKQINEGLCLFMKRDMDEMWSSLNKQKQDQEKKQEQIKQPDKQALKNDQQIQMMNKPNINKMEITNQAKQFEVGTKYSFEQKNNFENKQNFQTEEKREMINEQKNNFAYEQNFQTEEKREMINEQKNNLSNKTNYLQENKNVVTNQAKQFEVGTKYSFEQNQTRNNGNDVLLANSMVVSSSNDKNIMDLKNNLELTQNISNNEKSDLAKDFENELDAESESHSSTTVSEATMLEEDENKLYSEWTRSTQASIIDNDENQEQTQIQQRQR